MLREAAAARVAEEPEGFAGAPPQPVPARSPGLADMPSPVDLPAPPAPLPHGLRWTSQVIAWATLVLLLLNAHALRDWAYRLPPSETSARLVVLAETWYDFADRAGLNRPVEAMHGEWQQAKDARFHQEGSRPQGDDRS